MDLKPGMTKQGLRDLNVLYPKKKKPRAGEAQPGEAGAEPVRAAEPPVADAAAVTPQPLP
jgi:hypothetical protein